MPTSAPTKEHHIDSGHGCISCCDDHQLVCLSVCFPICPPLSLSVQNVFVSLSASLSVAARSSIDFSTWLWASRCQLVSVCQSLCPVVVVSTCLFLYAVYFDMSALRCVCPSVFCVVLSIRP